MKISYAYTYDDGDNMITKVEPFVDDFNDDAATGWSLSSGFAAASTMLKDTDSGAATDAAWKNDFTDDDQEIRFSYRRTSSNSGDRIQCYARFVDWDNYVRVEFFGDGTCRIIEKSAGTATVTDTGTAASITNTWYDVRIVCDDTSVKAYHKTGTNLESQVLSATSAVTTSSKIGIVTWSNTTADLDDIWLFGDSLSNTTTFAVNNANELTTMTDPNGTTTFGFDAWGRMTSKERGSYGATYEYRYGQMLASTETNWPSEDDVSYQYGADKLRRERSSTNSYRWYRWSGNPALLSEEDSAGTLEKSIVGRTLATVPGDPTTGDYEFHTHDVLLTTSQIRSHNMQLIGRLDFSPYGGIQAADGSMPLQLFTGHQWDPQAQVYYTYFRSYSPVSNRWFSRDPLNFLFTPNAYAYTGLDPINNYDLQGDIGVKGLAAVIIILLAAGVGIAVALDCYQNLTGAFGYWSSYEFQADIQQPEDDLSQDERNYREFMRHCGAACEVANRATLGGRCVTLSRAVRGTSPSERDAEDTGIELPLPKGGVGSLDSIRNACFTACQSHWNVANPNYPK